jgi:hypothetical protein
MNNKRKKIKLKKIIILPSLSFTMPVYLVYRGEWLDLACARPNPGVWTWCLKSGFSNMGTYFGTNSLSCSHKNYVLWAGEYDSVVKDLCSMHEALGSIFSITPAHQSIHFARNGGPHMQSQHLGGEARG